MIKVAVFTAVIAFLCGGCCGTAQEEALQDYRELDEKKFNSVKNNRWSDYRQMILAVGGGAADVFQGAQAYYNAVAAMQIKAECQAFINNHQQKKGNTTAEFRLLDREKRLIDAVARIERSRIELAGVIGAGNSDGLTFAPDEMKFLWKLPEVELLCKIALMNVAEPDDPAELIRQIKICHLDLITLEEKIILEQRAAGLIRKELESAPENIATLWQYQLFTINCRYVELKRDRIISWYRLLKLINLTSLTAKEIFEYRNRFREAEIRLYGKPDLPQLSDGKVSK